MRKAIIPAFLLVLGSTVLGATVRRQEPSGASARSLTSVSNHRPLVQHRVGTRAGDRSLTPAPLDWAGSPVAVVATVLCRPYPANLSQTVSARNAAVVKQRSFGRTGCARETGDRSGEL
jgi:hypothetical protein